ncbi:hypothetical protein MA16_Dca006807 [Dendrobium catenatum]|uniref:Uncharacterized protein n=1 Tax=Dendrobium catenatum TaxID=906689 RepID=A0A2I0W977_9ASPA|nr:hypothetical protein MA16_Dca006807 [Dendrobium catenatum]
MVPSSGPSWSLVYLNRGGSRPNLTEGSLSAAMGFFVQGDLVDLRIWPDKRTGESYLHFQRAPLLASDQNVVTSDPLGMSPKETLRQKGNVGDGTESNNNEGDRRSAREGESYPRS